MTIISLERLAKEAYETYCKEAGVIEMRWKRHIDDFTPCTQHKTWAELDENGKACWTAVAERIRTVVHVAML